MMDLFDTHAHLNFEGYKDDAKEVITRSFSEGMSGIINVGSRFDNSEIAVKQAQQYEKMFAAIGFHPDHLKEIKSDEVGKEIEKFNQLAQEKKVVAIGEIGFDNYYYKTGVNKDTPENRKKERHIAYTFMELASMLSLPVIVHSRDAEQETVQMLSQFKGKQAKGGVVHCFTGSLDMAKKVTDLGFYIGFTGIITYPNTETLTEVVKEIPLDNILIETDAPFLAPQKYRGKRNEPLYVLEVAKKIAEIKDIELQKVIDKTAENAKSLFGIR